MAVATIEVDTSRTSPFLVSSPNGQRESLYEFEIDRRNDPVVAEAGSFCGQICLDNRIALSPEQSFVIFESDTTLKIRSQPINPYPTIEFVFDKESGDLITTARPTDASSVESEILYTRFFLQLLKSKSFSLVRSDGFIIIDLNVTSEMREHWNKIEYRAKLSRKLAFIEYFYKIEFVIPDYIPWRDSLAIETLFRGITEGEFTFPAGRNFRIPFSSITPSALNTPPFSGPGEWTYTLPFTIEEIFHKKFEVGRRVITAKHATVANPRVLKTIGAKGSPEDVEILLFDQQVTCRFENYTNPKRLDQNKRRLNAFKSRLGRNEPTYLVSLVDSHLAEVPSDVAVQMVNGILQFYDFPDRFSTSDPILEDDKWHLKIGLFYRDIEPIWLDDVLVHRTTGKVEFGLSFDDLLRKGQIMAREAIRET